MVPSWRHISLLLLLSAGSIAGKLSNIDDEDAAPFLEGKNIYSSQGQGNTLHCDIYLAPSPIGGWGVYAARDFEENEVVEIAPRFLQQKTYLLGENVLDDYHYGFLWQVDLEDTSFGVAIFGMSMWYNHGAGDKHNVQFTGFGRGPGKNPHEILFAETIGFLAKRKIYRGEELLSSYGETDQWFMERGLTMAEPSTEVPKVPSLAELDDLEQQHCSKMYAGLGQASWLNRILPTLEEIGSYTPMYDYKQHLPVQDHPTAVAKHTIQVGHLIEMAPALVLPMDQVVDSAFEPVSIFWNDWDEDHKVAIYKLHELGAFRMKGRNAETGHRSDDLLNYFEDTVVLPAAGSLGLVRKVGRDNDTKSNCRIEILSANDDEETGDVGSAGLVLKLIATKDIQVGEELKLDLPDSSSWKSKASLLQHLALLGQPIPKSLADPYNYDIFDDHQSKAGDEL